MDIERVGKLTPFQVRHGLMVERDKQGAVKLDPPFRGGPGESSMEDEWRAELAKVYTDPDAVEALALVNAET